LVLGKLPHKCNDQFQSLVCKDEVLISDVPNVVLSALQGGAPDVLNHIKYRPRLRLVSHRRSLCPAEVKRRCIKEPEKGFLNR
jgi:hypothetical protein